MADFQLIERDRFRPEAKLCDQRMQFLTRRRGMADIQRQLRFVRPLGLRPRKRPQEGAGGIEIETFRLQLGLEAGAAACRPDWEPPPGL